jgi:uncharacterized membrane protein YhaH (DUF805 family)
MKGMLMSFFDSIKTVLTKYADFKGVASRSEFWWWWFFTVIAGVALGSTSGTVEDSNTTVAGIASAFSLGTFIPTFAVTWRRYHDVGLSGKWLLLTYILPVVLLVVGVVIAFPVLAQELEMYGTVTADALPKLITAALVPLLGSLAIWIFNLVVTLRGSKSAAEGNKYAA